MATSFQNLVITVDNPQKHLTVMESYMSFRVTSKVINEGDESVEHIVRRRYNDFLWLRHKLIEAYPTLIVPCLPGKHGVLGHLDRYSRPFILCRMALLNSYLNRLASHPVFSSCNVFKIFLSANSTDFSMYSKGSDGLFDKISMSLQTLATYLPKNMAINAEFEACHNYINNLSKKFTELQSISNRIYKERVELGSELIEAQNAVRIWYEQEPELKVTLKLLHDALISLNDVHREELVDNYPSTVQHMLEEYILNLDSVKEALQRRDSIQVSFETTVEENSRKKEEREKLRALQAEANGFGFGMWKLSAKEKVKQLQSEIPNLDRLAEENLDRMEIANEAMRADLTRWTGDTKSEIKSILGRIADQHISYYQKSVEIWEAALKGISSHRCEP